MINFAYLDSGTGGLPYLQYLRNQHPGASCIYVGDTKNFPYGEKTSEQIIENSCSCVKKIIEKWNPNAVVIACNTISVTALDEMRKRFPDTPIVGTVPAIKPAALISKTKKIGLLATRATVEHAYTKKLISDFASDCTVVSRGDPELISFIEHDYFNAGESERLNAVMPAVSFFKEKECDVIVLACTHFLNMADYIQKAAGQEIKVIDSREGVTKHAFEVERKSLETSYEKSRLFITGFSANNDMERYVTFCQQNKIDFGGILE